jgi:transcriptional regulator with XRE-family HTH domain
MPYVRKHGAQRVVSRRISGTTFERTAIGEPVTERIAITPEELRETRQKMGLSHKRLAAWLGVAERTLRRWENGEHPIQRPGALKLALEAVQTYDYRLDPPERPPLTKETFRERRQALGLSQRTTGQELDIRPFSDRDGSGVAHLERGTFGIRSPRLLDLALERLELPNRRIRPFPKGPTAIRFDATSTDTEVAATG